MSDGDLKRYLILSVLLVSEARTLILRWTTVVCKAQLGPNQSEREKDNRAIVFLGHVTHLH